MLRWLRDWLSAIGLGLAVWVSLGTLAVSDAEATRRLGLLPSPWLLLFVVAVLALIVRRRKPGSAAIFGSLLLLLPWLPLPVPDAFLIWTGPIVVLIWLAIALPALANSLRHLDPRAVYFVTDPRIASCVAGVLAFA